MKKWLTIGEAAQHLGLSVDRVRRLENEGTLEAKRTAGGHRRFHIAVLDSYRKRMGQSTRAKPGRRESSKPKRAPVRPVDPFLEIPDDPDEWIDVEPPATRSVAEPAAPRFTRHPEPARTDSVRAVPGRPAKATQNPAHDQALRLLTIKTWGLVSIPSGTPASWQAEVLEDLERNVIAEKYPEWLPLNLALELVGGRVRDVLRPYEKAKALEAQRVEDERQKAAEEKERQAREREQAAEEQRQIQQLIARGKNTAWLETLLWDREDREGACEEISEVLEASVGADWSKDDVEELVDDILDKYGYEDRETR